MNAKNSQLPFCFVRQARYIFIVRRSLLLKAKGRRAIDKHAAWHYTSSKPEDFERNSSNQSTLFTLPDYVAKSGENFPSEINRIRERHESVVSQVQRSTKQTTKHADDFAKSEANSIPSEDIVKVPVLSSPSGYLLVGGESS